ncbi:MULTISPECIES: DUF5304 domain-containing protein [Streptomyces]|uniref:DUF5304 domain-containing protein n=1 Tax=Streptomyces hydrogenans TaxID=1873719 RepID=A0ABQ3P914_9ACTN|nr:MULTISPECIES: DUF5304 domain-containing protein [Streptomyces]MCM1947845.1 DUF5304 domain-containing protein [Streptomyces sp. G2]GHG11058.1 hypothetical protein GCM10018784_24620 [Streptomyces hydrogenans]GHI21513.1 hypothetical protein Shyd_28840 [Streptomyces hydrogenans]
MSSDPDAWADACAEDLEAEKARRRARHGEEPGSPAEEFRRLFEAVAEKLTGGLGAAAPLFGGQNAAGAAAQAAETVKGLVNQAKAAVEPVIERNPQVFDHLAAAGSELLAAYRSAVEGHETRWTRGPDLSEDDPRRAADTPREPSPEERRDGEDGPTTGRPIDLD